jgi:hypothetical protein
MDQSVKYLKAALTALTVHSIISSSGASQVGTLAKMDKKTFLFQEEVQIGQGSITALANSSE